MNIPQIEFPNSDSEFIKNPYPYLKELRESSSLHLDTLSDLALITRFEDVKNVQTNKVFSSADPEEIENPNRNEEEHEYFWRTENFSLLNLEGQLHSITSLASGGGSVQAANSAAKVVIVASVLL